MSTQQKTTDAKRRGLTQDDGGKREVASLVTISRYFEREGCWGRSIKSPVCIRFLTMVAVCIAIHRGYTGYTDYCACVFFVLTSILQRS